MDHPVPFRAGRDDDTPVQYFQISERAQALVRAAADAPLADTDEALRTQANALRTLLQRFEGCSVWTNEQLVPVDEHEELDTQRQIQVDRANRLQDQLTTMTALAERLATLENPAPAGPRVKPVEVKSPEPYEGSRADQTLHPS